MRKKIVVKKCLFLQVCIHENVSKPTAVHSVEVTSTQLDKVISLIYKIMTSTQSNVALELLRARVWASNYLAIIDLLFDLNARAHLNL